MLIDLGRNDLGRIAKIGSVKLTDKMSIERKVMDLKDAIGDITPQVAR
jgi:anthranilate/para-aminobenzoate synthase component I